MGANHREGASGFPIVTIKEVPSSREQAPDPLEEFFVRHLRSGTGASLSEQASPPEDATSNNCDAPSCDDVTTGGDTP